MNKKNKDKNLNKIFLTCMGLSAFVLFADSVIKHYNHHTAIFIFYHEYLNFKSKSKGSYT